MGSLGAGALLWVHGSDLVALWGCGCDLVGKSTNGRVDARRARKIKWLWDVKEGARGRRRSGEKWKRLCKKMTQLLWRSVGGRALWAAMFISVCPCLFTF
jgi:hypothetical protein